MNWQSLFSPNTEISKQTKTMLSAGWIVVMLLLWQFVDIHFLPKPTEILGAFGRFREQGTFLEFGTSIWTMLEAIFWTTLITLSLAYLSVVPFFKPPIRFISGLRYLGLVGLMVAFTLIAPTQHILKVMVLTFGMTVFYLADMVHVVGDIPQEEYDHAEALGMSNLRIVYEVVVRGTMAAALASLVVNAAMGWMMLTAVEGVVRSEGGIGTVLLDMNKHMDLPAVGAILISLYILGTLQSAAIGFIRNYIVAPYARLGKGHS